MTSRTTRDRSVQSASAGPSLPAALAFGLAGSLAGSAAAVGSYQTSGSLWLAGCAFVLTYYVLGYALVRVIGRPHVPARLGYYALYPVFSILILGGVVLAGGPPWLAVVLGIGGGPLLQGLVGRWLIPTIAAEEKAPDPIRRWLRPQTWGEPGPHDLVPPWMRRNK